MGLISRVSSRTYRKMTFDNAKKLYLQAQEQHESGKTEQCAQTLKNCKMVLISSTQFLPNAMPSTKEHALTRDMLELSVLNSIQAKNIEGFEKAIVQLKPYYQDFSSAGLNESSFKDMMLGLHLLCLLANKKFGEFHAELEKLSAGTLNSLYIQHPVQLEQSLMEGNYGKVFLAKSNTPAQEYHFFMDHLMSTIRDEIADCVEQSFSSNSPLPIEEAARLLHFPTVNDDFSKFVQSKSSWRVADGKIMMKNSQGQMNVGSGEAVCGEIDSKETTKACIDYAKQMELII